MRINMFLRRQPNSLKDRVPSQFVLKSIRTQVNSYSSQFILILVNSYSKFWSIRTHLVNSYSCLVSSYSFWSIRTHFGQFVLKYISVRIDQNEYELTKN